LKREKEENIVKNPDKGVCSYIIKS
jgi:hypothetical protein